ncbi:NUDIX domain-containing protein [Psychrobacter sp.]|uniref:NUDIX domain-containing protein n=1 Tax=Psychrobacter sp. TaxID=56811 RepID=UPI003BB18440
MASQTTMPIKKDSITIINVAVAVIHYKNQYLLGFRDASQHQGNRYEFVGGKIEHNETAKQALIREVAEEIGIEIDNNIAVKLGRLHHDYGDKQVCLQVYCIEITALQYEQYKNQSHGLEGQALTWVDKSKLLKGDYHLPAANKTILDWLRLPAQIAITYPLAHFSEYPQPMAAWLTYHKEYLAEEAWVYVRIRAAGLEGSADNTAQLLRLRPDIKAIVPYHSYSNNTNCQVSKAESLKAKYLKAEDSIIDSQIVANHLTHSQLMQWLNTVEKDNVSNCTISASLPIIVSCHDIDSIEAANQLACARLTQQLSPVIGIFLSPVLFTQTHPDVPPLGWKAWSELAELANMPVIGLGGLSPSMIEQAVQHGGVAVAGIRQFFK